jgi:hypothetical protein
LDKAKAFKFAGKWPDAGIEKYDSCAWQCESTPLVKDASKRKKGKGLWAFSFLAIAEK